MPSPPLSWSKILSAEQEAKVAGRIDTLVPPPQAPTWFARMGHWLTLIWGIVFLALSLVAMRFAGGYPTRNT